MNKAKFLCMLFLLIPTFTFAQMGSMPRQALVTQALDAMELQRQTSSITVPTQEEYTLDYPEEMTTAEDEVTVVSPDTYAEDSPVYPGEDSLAEEAGAYSAYENIYDLSDTELEEPTIEDEFAKEYIRDINTTRDNNFKQLLKKYIDWFPWDDSYIKVGLRLGYMVGNTTYDYEHKTSELEYPMSNLMMGSACTLGIKDWSFNTQTWFPISRYSGYEMKDKDFTSAGTMYLYTKSKADLDAVILDGNVRYDFYKGNIPRKMSFLAIAKTDQIRLGALLGYRYEKFDYEMHDIYYDTDLISGRQGQTLYSGQKVLTYKLQNYLPYLGIAADIIGKNYGLGMTFKYSFYPTAEDVDNHILRGLTFYGQYGNHRSAYMVGLNGFWRWTKLWKVRFGMDATIIRIEGRTWEEQRSPAWDGDQSTATNEFIYWSGLEYKF